MIQANKDIRELIAQNRLRYWEVAQAIGIQGETFSRWLRTPLKGERRQRVLDAIDQLTKQLAQA